jgi:hypothetical protein
LLLPRELRPPYWRRAGLILAGLFFIAIAVITTMDKLGMFKPKTPPKPAASATEPALVNGAKFS